MADQSTIDAVGTSVNEPKQPSSGGSQKVWSIPGDFDYGRQKLKIEKIRIKGSLFVLSPGTPYIPLKEGSILEFEGFGLSLFDSAFFSPSKRTLRREGYRNDAIISFTVPNLSGEVKDGGSIFMRLANGSTSVTIAPYLIYSYKDDQDKKEDKNGKGADDQDADGESSQGKKDSTLIADTLINPTLAGVVGALGQGLSGGAGSARSTPAPVSSGSGPTQPKKTEGDQTVDDYDDSSDSSQQQTTQVAQPTTVQQAAELVGEYIDKNPEVIVNQQVRTEVLSALGGGGSEQVVSERLQNLSVEGRAALQASVTSRISSQGGSVGEQLKTALNIVGRQVSSASVSGGGAGTSASGQLKTSVEVTGSQPAAAQSGSVSAQAEGQTTVSASISAQASPTGNQGAVKQQSSPQNLNLKQSAEIVGEFLDKNPGAVPNSQTRGNLLNALQSGNVAGLGTAEKAALQSVANPLGAQPDGESGNRLKSAADIVLQAADAGSPPAVQQVEAKPVSEGQNQESNLPSQPVSEPLVGNGKVDGIEKQQPGPADSGEDVDSEIPPVQKTPVEKIPSANEGIDGAKPAMPAGMKGMQDNKNLLGNKLNLPQNEGLGKPASGVGSEPKANSQQAGKSDLPDARANEDQPSPAAPLGQQSAGAGPLNESQQSPEQGPPGSTPPAETEPGQKDEQQPGQNAEDAEQEKDQEEDQDAESGLPGQKTARSSAAKQEELDKKTKEAIELANKSMNEGLITIAVNLWWLSIPTFGIAILVGAVLGDFLWAFKTALIKRALSPLLTTDELKNKAEEIAKEIKFNGLVKLNIVLMNLAVAVIICLVLLFIVAILKGLCDNWVTGAAAYVAGLGDVCKAVG